MIATDGLELRVADDAHVCAGSVARLADDIARIRRFSALEDPGFPVRLWLGEEFVATRCKNIKDAGGCAWGSAESAAGAAANLDIAAHEMAHVVRLQHQLWGPLMFEEGFATLQNRRNGVYGVSIDASRSALAPTDLLDMTSAELQSLAKYEISAHFLAFLIDRHSEADVAAFFRTPAFEVDRGSDDELEPALLDAFGGDLEELTQQWRSEARDYYAFGELCPTEVIAAWDEGAIVQAGVLDCESSSGTRGPHRVNEESYTVEGEAFCFSLDANAEVAARFDASLDMGVYVHLVDCTAENTGGIAAIDAKFIEAGTDQRLPFAGCTWRAVPTRYIAFDETEAVDDVVSYELTLTREPL